MRLYPQHISRFLADSLGKCALWNINDERWRWTRSPSLPYFAHERALELFLTSHRSFDPTLSRKSNQHSFSSSQPFSVKFRPEHSKLWGSIRSLIVGNPYWKSPTSTRAKACAALYGWMEMPFTETNCKARPLIFLPQMVIMGGWKTHPECEESET